MKTMRFVTFGIGFVLSSIFMSGCLSPKSPKESIVKFDSVNKYDAARDLAQKGKYNEAINVYEQFLAQHPNSPLVKVATYDLAVCYDVLKDVEQARKHYQQVIDKYPGDFWAGLAQEKLEALQKQTPSS